MLFAEVLPTLLEFVFLVALVIWVNKDKRWAIFKSKKNLRLDFNLKEVVTIFIVTLVFLFVEIIFFKRVEAVDIFKNSLSWGGFIYLIWRSVLIAPIFEETVCRGIFLGCFYDLLAKKTKRQNKKLDLTIIVITVSLIFMLLHGNKLKMWFLFFDSILFSLIYLLSKNNLAPAIVSHATLNLIIILITNRIV